MYRYRASTHIQQVTSAVITIAGDLIVSSDRITQPFVVAARHAGWARNIRQIPPSVDGVGFAPTILILAQWVRDRIRLLNPIERIVSEFSAPGRVQVVYN